MKRNCKLSLRMRLTLLMAALLVFACAFFAAVSILSARKIYAEPPAIPPLEAMPQLPDRPNGNIHTQLNKSIEAKNNAFTISSFVCFGLIIGLGTAATYVLAGRALRPVTDLSKTIEDIDENNLFIQIAKPSADDEIARLSTSFNHMTGKLQKAFESQKRFAANAAHELKTPLAAIITDIEVLQITDQPSAEEYRETVDNVLDNAQRLSKLIHDLLQINVADPTRYESFDGGEMFAALRGELLSALEEHHISIQINIEKITLFGAKRLLYTVFYNLLSNAVRYNYEGGMIHIMASREDMYTIISIADTGIGIDESEQIHIFDPFYCVDQSRSRALGGSGLGLSIAKEIVEKHKGKIELQSVLGRGSTFVVRLPGLQ